MVKMRYDLFICFFIACLLLVSINAVGDHYIDKKTEQSTEEKVISADEIGGQADDSIPIVTSIAEMKEQDRFTLQYDDDYECDDYIYADGQIWSLLELPSGENVVADIYTYSIQYIYDDDSMWDYTKLFPVGKLVEKDISQEMIDAAAEEGYELSATDCYIDMANGNNKQFDPAISQAVTYILMIVIPVAAFILIHILGVKIGIFPPIIPRRNEQQG